MPAFHAARVSTNIHQILTHQNVDVFCLPVISYLQCFMLLIRVKHVMRVPKRDQVGLAALGLEEQHEHEGH